MDYWILYLLEISQCLALVLCGNQCTVYNQSDDFNTGLIIHTPGYPDEHYDNSLTLCWEVYSTSTTMCIQTKDTDLENGFDYLFINTGLPDAIEITGRHDGIVSTECSAASQIRLEFEADAAVTGYGFQACVCSVEQESPSCHCSWIPGSNWASWSEDPPHDDESLTPGIITAICIGVMTCVAVPMIIAFVMCCPNKCKWSDQQQEVSAQSEMDLVRFFTRGRQPRPRRVVRMEPPPYTPSGPPSYEDAMGIVPADPQPSGDYDHGFTNPGYIASSEPENGNDTCQSDTIDLPLDGRDQGGTERPQESTTGINHGDRHDPPPYTLIDVPAMPLVQ